MVLKPRILVHDYVGHPFQVQLSRELARRGYNVLHLYSASIQTPRGRLARAADDPPGFDVEPIRLAASVRKEAFVRRWFQEVEYGRRLVKAVASFKPDVVLSANTPLEAQRALAELCRRSGYRFVYWVQDLYGVAAHRILRRKLPVVGDLMGRHYVRMEERLIRRSDHIVLISADFATAIAHALPPADRVSVIPNWAPLDEIPVAVRDNAWSRSQGLAGRPVVLYAGTLGMKHNPAMLLELARQLGATGEARLVVVSEGRGAEWLEAEARAETLTSVVRLDFQPFERMPEVLGAADVLLAILEAEAGVFSVPSKILTYLAAGRPIVAAIPASNLAAKVLADSGAGSVVDPGDPGAFVQATLELLEDRQERDAMGQRGRAYAEREFDIARVADRFEPILCG